MFPLLVRLSSQDCVVAESAESGPGAGAGAGAGSSSSSADKSVTFLFKYAVGACPKSYGLNVARLARLPESVVRRAAEKSEEFEVAVAEAEAEKSAWTGFGVATAATPPHAIGAHDEAMRGTGAGAGAAAAGGAGGRPLGASPDSLPGPAGGAARSAQLHDLFERASRALHGPGEGAAKDLDAVYALVCHIRGRA